MFLFLNVDGKMMPLDHTSIEFLEEVSDNNIVLPEKKVANEDYVFGVDDLENLSEPVKVVATPQKRILVNSDENDKELKESAFLRDTDVCLRDIVEKVFHRSERIFVIVRDDKIEYANKAFLKLLGIKSETEILQQKFLKFVARSDWNFLVQNIGALITNNEAMEINLVSQTNKSVKVKFEAMYLPDNLHFTFILIGEKNVGNSVALKGMYDSLTGLPNFYLFEDRVQVCVNYENYKDVRQKRNIIAVVGIAIDNFEALKSLGIHELILRKLAEKLVLSVKKTYTVGSGLKYHFWILLPDISDEETLKLELAKIQAVCKEPVADNFTTHELSVSIGVSIFPEPATSAKKLIEQAILSLQKAQKEGGNRMQIFGL